MSSNPADRQNAPQEKRPLNIKEISPVRNVIKSEDRAIVPADIVKVVVDRTLGQCTFIFYKRVYNTKYAGKGVAEIDTIDDEDFLHVKVPLTSALEVMMFMAGLVRNIRENPKNRGSWFGPNAWIKTEKPQ